MIFIKKNIGNNIRYIAVDTKYASTGYLFNLEEKHKKKLKIRECKFSVDERGGLKLILLDAPFELKDIHGCVKCIFSDIGEFIPIKAVDVGDDLFELSSCNDSIINDIFNNKDLKEKAKYVICKDAVKKVRYSHTRTYKEHTPYYDGPEEITCYIYKVE